MNHGTFLSILNMIQGVILFHLDQLYTRTYFIPSRPIVHKDLFYSI